MGIQGLLPVLKSIIEQKHVSKYAGTKVAVDTVRRPAGVRGLRFPPLCSPQP
jgi:hypothetical protein